MMNKQQFLRQHPGFDAGFELYSDDGEKLGKVTELDDDSLTVEKGFFFPREFTCRYDDIAQVEADRAVIAHKRDDLAHWRDEKYEGWDHYDRLNRRDTTSDTAAGSRTPFAGGLSATSTTRPSADMASRSATAAGSSTNEARLQLHEEELRANKSASETEVHIRKVVHTEMQHLTVPVTKEELVVEHTPVTDRPATAQRAATTDTGAFAEEEVTIPLREERVEVSKRPVVKKEVRVAKKLHTEQEQFEEQVRKEDIKVDQAGNPAFRKH